MRVTAQVRLFDVSRFTIGEVEVEITRLGRDQSTETIRVHPRR